MEGTSAREHREQREPQHNEAGSFVQQLIAAPDSQSLRRLLFTEVNSLVGGLEIFMVMSKSALSELDFDVLQTESRPAISAIWLKTHLEKRPDLYRKLCEGQAVNISAAEASNTPRPAKEASAHITLVPVAQDRRLLGIVGLVSAIEDQPADDVVRAVQAIAAEAAPGLQRRLELEALRSENRQLRETIQRLLLVEKTAWELETENSDLQAMARIRGHVYVNVAHELRTPLAAIRGYVRMVIDGRAGEINPRQREFLSVAVENANRMIHLVSWMGKLFESDEPLTLTGFDLREVWSECIGALEANLAAKSIIVRAGIPDEPFPLIGDRNRILRAFRQILCTALHFSDSGSELNVSLSRGREGEVTLKVHGITHEIPNVLLSPDGDSPTKANPIDLAILHTDVGIHGGRLFIRRSSEEGSVILATLPSIQRAMHQGSAQP